MKGDKRRGKGITEQLRAVPMGATIVLSLPNARAIDSYKSIAYKLRHELECRFKAKSDFANRRLTLTKLPYEGENVKNQPTRKRGE